MSKANNLAFRARGALRLAGASALSLAQNATGTLTFTTKPIDSLGGTLSGQNLQLPKGTYRIQFIAGAFAGGGTVTSGDGLNLGILVNGTSKAVSRVAFQGANTGVGFQGICEDIISVNAGDNITFRVSTSHANGLNLITTDDWTRVLVTPAAP